MDGERSRLPMISRERWGGKVYPEVVIAEDFPERRLVMMRRNTHKTAITIDSSFTVDPIDIMIILHGVQSTHRRLAASIAHRLDRPTATSQLHRSLARSLPMLPVRLLYHNWLDDARRRSRARFYSPYAIAAAVATCMLPKPLAYNTLYLTLTLPDTNWISAHKAA